MLTSATPGTERSCGLMIQSWTVRSSVSVLSLAGDEVVEDLAEAGGDRAELRAVDARAAARRPAGAP